MKNPSAGHYIDIIDYDLKYVDGRITFSKFGRIESLDTADGTVTVAAFKELFVPKSVGEQLSIVSSSANDAVGGSGATQVYMYAIDSNGITSNSFDDGGIPWNVPTEVISLNGTTPVLTSGTDYVGIERLAIGISGSGRVNAGVITVTGVTTGDTYAYIIAGKGITQQTMHFTPAGWVSIMGDGGVFLHGLKASGGSSPRITFELDYFDGTLNSDYGNDIYILDTAIESYIPIPGRLFTGSYRSGGVMQVKASSSQNGALVFCRYSGYMVRV